jgi:hypothetical protein
MGARTEGACGTCKPASCHLVCAVLSNGGEAGAPALQGVALPRPMLRCLTHAHMWLHVAPSHLVRQLLISVADIRAAALAWVFARERHAPCCI